MLLRVFESESERMESEWREGDCVFIDELVPRFKASYLQLKLVTLNFCSARERVPGSSSFRDLSL